MRRCRRTRRVARAVRHARLSRSSPRRRSFTSLVRTAVPFQFGRRRVSARRGLHPRYSQASFPQFLAAACVPFLDISVARLARWSQRRSRRSDGVRLARVVRLLEMHGVSTWSALHDWLTGPVEPTRCRRRVSPMPRDVRLSLPHAPGIYRMLRTDGSVLYVGKAASLHLRVNSYFGKQNGVPERMLEMCRRHVPSRSTSHEVRSKPRPRAGRNQATPTPYNVALTSQDRALSFTSPDLSARSSQPSSHCPLGPFASARRLINSWHSLGQTARVTSGPWGPDGGTFNVGYERLCATHPEMSRMKLSAHAKLLGLARACGEKVGETATLMKTTSTKRSWLHGVDPEFVRVPSSGSRCGRRSHDAARWANPVGRFERGVAPARWQLCAAHCDREQRGGVERGSRHKRDAIDSTGLPPSSRRTS